MLVKRCLRNTQHIKGILPFLSLFLFLAMIKISNLYRLMQKGGRKMKMIQTIVGPFKWSECICPKNSCRSIHSQGSGPLRGHSAYWTMHGTRRKAERWKSNNETVNGDRRKLCVVRVFIPVACILYPYTRRRLATMVEWNQLKQRCFGAICLALFGRSIGQPLCSTIIVVIY